MWIPVTCLFKCCINYFYTRHIKKQIDFEYRKKEKNDVRVNQTIHTQLQTEFK